jgi:hypothetical protein
VSTELEVLNRKSGELLDVSGAPTDHLVAFLTDTEEVRQQITDAEAIVHSEIVGRMDRAGTWTHRVRLDSEIEYEISAPSPEAGTTAHDPAKLEEELAALIERGVIEDVAAAKALKRTATVTVRVPIGVSLEEGERGLRKALGESDLIESVSSSRSVVQAGINALAKIRGTKAALERATTRREPPRRRVRLKIKTKDKR